jgi:mannose-6-phosphate isomerase-like protein (cupin superfamily)
MEPGGFQDLDAHEPKQMYFILEGQGMMVVDGKARKVQAGDCIFFPSGAEHGLKNSGEGALKYLTAASPSFTSEQCDDWWPFPPVKEKV